MNVSAGRHPSRARHRVRTTLLCTAAALAVAVVPASADAARTASVRAPDPVVVVDCASEPQVRPEEYLLACGDGNNRLVELRWDTWGPGSATATGTDMVNDCRPYCAAGRFRPYPVTVTLGDPEAWPGHPDVQRFTTIRLIYTDTAPAPVPKDVTYKLVW
ncbi:hypothetical protein ACFWUZ_19595 [Streptomyces sp. NPDC058646]|uniref:hypothetical protein n=1 Tax=Streptomyces sp. NPDC058646 TaxID=3346574 RepID=UPI003647C506